MEGKTQISAPTTIVCPTCGARYAMPRYQEGQKYGCQRCSASLLFGKFALLQELGRGGFGVVYRAWQADLQRTVALKFLHTEGEETAERFIREARIAANLTHPNITAIYEVGKHEGKLYITMQFVDGTATNKMDLDSREAAMVVRDAALAVDYAHARDIIHRDIKPHNIMVTEERSGTSAAQTSRRVFVMDFGLARSVKQGSSLTAEGQVMGTPAFMSPEQAEGGSCDARSDVYSLGATLYALVTRRPPVEAETPVQVLMKVCQGAIIPPSKALPDIDRNLEAIILKAMARNPDDRYPTAARLASDLSMWLQGSTPDAGATVHLSASSKVVRGGEAPRAKAGMIVAAFAALLVAVAGAAAVWYLKQPPPAPADFAALYVDSEPSQATVSVEGATRTWTTPVVIRASELPPSPADVTVSLADHAPVTRRAVTWTKEIPGRLKETLKSATAPPPPPTPAPAAALEVTSEPPQATVTVGGREGTTPFQFKDLRPDTYLIEVSKPGYKGQKRECAVGPGESKRERFTLVRAQAPLAFRVTTNPKEATIFLNGAQVASGEIYQDQLPEGTANLEVRMAGYEPYLIRKKPGDPVDVPVDLQPQTGTFLLEGAAPRATVKAFVLPAGVKRPRDLALLWSENPSSIERALASIEPADAAFVTARLAELATRGEPGIRGPAQRLMSSPPAAAPMNPEEVPAADATGRTRIDRAWVVRRYLILATAPGRRDFVTDLLPERGKELRIPADMPALARVTVRTRPAIGQFVAVLEDGTRIPVVPGSSGILVPPGKVELEYTPPSDDPLLCKLAATKQVTDGFDLSGNLYALSGRAFERDGEVGRAVRSYTKALEEKAPPDEERAKLPEEIRVLYRAWIEQAVKKGKPLSKDAKKAVEEARTKPEEEAGRLLLEVYAAKDVPAAIRGLAAGALAEVLAASGQPYPSMEWFERSVEAGVDPGVNAQKHLTPVLPNYPGLVERWGVVARKIADLRAASQRRPVYLGLRTAEVPDRGLRVEGLAKGSPAAAAGLLLGEVVTEVGGAPVRAKAELDQAVEKAGVGGTLEMKVERLGESVLVTVTLVAAPAQAPEYVVPLPRVGELGLVSEKYGTHLRLDKGAQVQPGEALEVTRAGELVGELTVTKLLKPDSVYVDGGAEVQRGRGVVRKGDEVRKARK